MKDFFGFNIYPGDVVAIPWNQQFRTAEVLEIQPAEDLIKIKYTDGGGLSSEYCTKSKNLIKKVLDPEDLKLLKFTMGAEQ